MNHFGGSLGGPIVQNKLFFFFDSEWVRIALPIVTATTVPTPAFQNYVLQQVARRSGLITVLPPAPARAFYRSFFALRQYGRNAAADSRLPLR